MGNANADNLIDRILAEAEETAQQIAAQAQASCDSIQSECDAQIAGEAAQFAKERATQVEEILGGARTRAELDGRKELLAEKRAILDSAFETAYQALCARSSEELTRLFASVLREQAQDGNVVFAARADRVAVEHAASEQAVKLIVAETDAPVERGFIVSGGSYEKDCSLRAILRDLREREETEVARILFSVR